MKSVAGLAVVFTLVVACGGSDSGKGQTGDGSPGGAFGGGVSGSAGVAGTSAGGECANCGGSGGTAGASVGGSSIGGAGASGGAALGGGRDAGTGGAGGSAGQGGSPTGGSSGTDGGTPPPPGPSCDGLPANCGPTSDENCCTSLIVPGGTFMMGRSDGGTDAYASGEADEQPEHSVAVSSLVLDKYEVTVGRFRKFKSAWDAGWRPAAGDGKHIHLGGGLVSSGGLDEPGWVTAWTSSITITDAALSCGEPFGKWTATAGANELSPMNCINWYEAYAFCIWDGGFLPTEAEWEYAAAGGDDNRLYPWGGTAPGPDATLLIYDGCYDGDCSDVTPGDLAPVGSAPQGNARWGHADLAGSLYEWTLDLYASDWYSDNSATGADVVNITSGSNRILRGGSFGYGAEHHRAANRNDASSRNGGIGVRCARAP